MRIRLLLLVCVMLFSYTGAQAGDTARLTDPDMDFIVDEDSPSQEQGKRLEGISIGIDPGHQLKADLKLEPISAGSKEKKPRCQGGTRGVKTKRPEYEITLEVGLMLRDMLEAEGATVYMTRESHDVNISNIERATMINKQNVDLYLRLHCDGSTNPSANGIGLYVRKTGSKMKASLEAAKALMPTLLNETGAKKHGIFQSDTYSGLNWAAVPTVMIEMGFMTNAKEDALLCSQEYQEKLSAGMIEGVCSFLGR